MQRRDFLRSIGGAAAAMAIPGTFPAGALGALDPATSAGPIGTKGEGDAFWRQIQQAFSVDRSIVNLDNGAVCPSPRVVTEALVRYTWQQQEAPAWVVWDVLAPLWQGVREGLARLSGCDAGEIAIVRNATEALNTVLLGLELAPGDEILATTHDYWAVQDALDQRSARDGIVVRRVEEVPVPARTMSELVEMYERHVTPRTRLILVTHPFNSNGQLFPVREICEMAHRKGVEVLVDGAQSFALVDQRISDLGCDYYGTSLHKWLLAPIGTGMLYIRKDKIGKVWPLFPPDPTDASKESMSKFHFQGTQSAAVGVAISEALAFHEEIGPRRKEERLRYLTGRWAERIRELPGARLYTNLEPGMSCGLATFALADIEARRLARHLWERHRILVQALPLVQTAASRHSPKTWAVRVTPNIYTTLDDLDSFCDVIEQVAKRGLPEVS